MNELEKLVQDLIRQGESEDVINSVIQQYKDKKGGKLCELKDEDLFYPLYFQTNT